MMKTKLAPNKKNEINLPEEIFNVKLNEDLLYQVVSSQQKRRKQPIACTKGRKEVKGGGRKPWPQKGTGRARHGSIRSPLWKGGGVTFGPKSKRDYSKKISKKMRRKTLFMVLAQKYKDKELFFVDRIPLKQPKTKLLKEKIEKIITEKKSTTLILLPQEAKEVQLACRNLPHYDTMPADQINALDVLKYKYIIIPKESLSIIKETFLTK